MRIGEVAHRLGVQVHVLRHWDEVGVVVPERTSSGQRRYTQEDVYRLRVVQACQDAGLSLREIKQVLHRTEQGRTAVIQDHLERIRAQRARFEATERFLVHVLTCTHDLLTRCGACARYAIPEQPGPERRHRSSADPTV